ncbi:MAG: DUF3450 domain-containing protein [Xanthomonadales bacterium]|nr:DUF3450 domain-containing protein [Xanthomonadales bacterium]
MRHLRAVGIAVLLSLTASAAWGQGVSDVMSAQQQGNSAAQASQERINDIVEQTRDLAGDYKAVVKEIEGLKVYNRLLETQVGGQNREIRQLDESMDEVTVIERQIVPLMIRMIDGLEQFISLDVPFLMDERSGRISDLRAMMERADVTAAEKFRRVMEAYQIENDYGRTIEAYKGVQTIDGGDREVDYLRVGRVGLYYQTLDTQYSGAWDQSARSWTDLGNTARAEIRDGLRIARKQTAPDLLTLPVGAPEAVQ